VRFRANSTFAENTAILHCHGNIYPQEALALSDAVVPLLVEQTTTIILDFAAVRRVDIGGLGTLVLLQLYVRSSGRSLRFCNLSPCVKDAIEHTRLNDLFEIYGTEQQAIAA
jgi:anti-anti-sigma factor